MKIKQVTKEEADTIIKSYAPIGLFILKEGDTYIGIDNSAGDCWVEEFICEDLCTKWLNGEVEMFDLELE